MMCRYGFMPHEGIGAVVDLNATSAVFEGFIEREVCL